MGISFLTFFALPVLGVAASLSARPNLSIGPKAPYHALPRSSVRDPSKVCTVAANATDAGPAIIAAAQACNNNGTVVFSAGQTYTIASPVDLTFLQSIDFAILGTVQFKSDVEYWEENMFLYPYQNAGLMWRFGGVDVNIYGNGTGLIDGLGNDWWKAYVANTSIIRPILFGTDGLSSGSITNLNMLNPPNWFNFIANSTDLLISNLNLQINVTNSSSPAHNTDGWDTYRSSNIVIQNSTIVNNDDCVSFKPNSTEILVQNLQCSGSHGISVGSLGQYLGEVDIVENIYVYNISMSNASDGARIKVWPGVAPDNTAVGEGGGTGYVKNVTYELLYNYNNAWAIELTQCYGADSDSACEEYPSSMVIEDILFKDFSGTTSTKYEPDVGTLVCSSPDLCINIQAEDINVSPPDGSTAEWICTNVDESLLDINCT